MVLAGCKTLKAVRLCRRSKKVGPPPNYTPVNTTLEQYGCAAIDRQEKIWFLFAPGGAMAGPCI